MESVGRLGKSARWLVAVIPRAPKKPGLLMRLFWLWQECFTPTGHALAAILLFAMFAGMVPGFWSAWVLCGLDFLFLLTLVVSLFCTSRFSKVSVLSAQVRHVTEGDSSVVSAMVHCKSRQGELYLGSFRMDPSLSCSLQNPRDCAAGESVRLECLVHTTCRGAFLLPRVAVVIPEIAGMMRAVFSFASPVELLVYPKIVRISNFAFLTKGVSGMVFAPLMMPSVSRGLDFVGVREYREGDSLRDLHHKAFARYGRPFTKEFEQERGAGVVLVLDVASPDMLSQMHSENAIRLAAGVALWLLERGILGRLFVGNEEKSLDGADSMRESLLQVMARIPRFDIRRRERASTWSPKARPMGPVLRIGVYRDDSPLVTKQIVVTGKHAESSDDSLLYVDGEMLAQSLLGSSGVGL